MLILTLTIGEILENDVADLEAAMDMYEKAADYAQVSRSVISFAVAFPM